MFIIKKKMVILYLWLICTPQIYSRNLAPATTTTTAMATKATTESLLRMVLGDNLDTLESGITEIVSAHLMFGDTLCRNLGRAFAKTWVGNCPPATYAPVNRNTVNSRFKKDLNLQIHLHKTFLTVLNSE